MSFLSLEEKSDLSKVFDVLHETFRKEIYAHKAGELVVLSENPNYSSVYGNPWPNGTQQTVVLRKQPFYARILYEDKQHLRVIDAGAESSLKLKLADGELRIKVDKEGKEYLEGAKKIEINGKLYEFTSQAKPHGLFDVQFFSFYLREVQ